MVTLLEAIASGKIEVAGIRKGDLHSLNQLVLDLSDAADGSLKRGDRLAFADRGQAVVIGVGNEVYGSNTFYHIYLTYPIKQ